MALEGIAGLPVAIGLTGAEDVPIVQGGTTKRTTTQAIADLSTTNNIQALLDSISTTQGSLLYRNALDWVALNPGTNGQFLQTAGAAANPAWATVSSGLTVGSTAISGGTTTRILYDNAGVLGEYSLTGTGTVVAMQTAPTFLTSITTPRALITQGTITADAPQIDGSVTWNNAAVTFTGWKLRVTDTASDVASLLLNIGLSGGSRLTLTKDGSFKVGDVDTALGDAGQLYFNSPNADIRLFAPGGTMKLRFGFGSQSILMPTDGLLGWGVPASVSTDLQLARDAANTLAQRNGTNAQALRVYNTYATAGVDFERFNIVWAGNELGLHTTAGGTGTGRSIAIGSSGAEIKMWTNFTGSQGWSVTNGNFLALTDNTYDIGASGATRPRTLFLGTGGIDSAGSIGSLGSVTAGGGGIFYFAGRTVMSSPADGNLLFNNTAGGDFGRLMFGGTNSSFPALKRVSSQLQVRLADDSEYANTRMAVLFLDNSPSSGGTGTALQAKGDGILQLQDFAGSSFGLLQFGGTTSSFPALKRSSTALHARLADDSAYAPFSAELTTLAAGTATPANGSSAARVLLGTTANFGVYYGSGAPTGLTAAQGSLYIRSDGTGVNDRAYINSSSGSGTTWTAIVTVG